MTLKKYSSSGPVDNEKLLKLEQEIINARKYLDNEEPYPTLDSRLDAIQSLLIDCCKYGGGGGLTQDLLLYDSLVTYTYDDVGNVIIEKSEGDLSYEREFIYDTLGRLKEEIIKVLGKTYHRQYIYSDGMCYAQGARLVPSISTAYRKRVMPFVFTDAVTYELDGRGNILKELVEGNFNYEKTFEYNQDGLLVHRVITVDGVTYPKEYTRDSSGLLIKETGFELDVVSTGCGPSYSLYDTTTEYIRDGKGFIIGKEVTGDFNYSSTYEYNGNRLAKEILKVNGEEYVKTYTSDVKGNILSVAGITEKEYGDLFGIAYNLITQLCQKVN